MKFAEYKKLAVLLSEETTTTPTISEVDPLEAKVEKIFKKLDVNP